jgi:Cu(I)/Ag(I) efflux system membrane fusion protein
MKRHIVLLLVLAIGLASGLYLGRHTGNGAVEAPPAEREILYWVVPMDPNYRRDQPGKSPMGMDLIPVYADEAEADGGVSISPALENSLGVRSEPARVRPLWRRIEATGYVGFDETRISNINLRTQGWIVSLHVNSEGERVARGDLLFELYSPELVNAQKEYLQVLARGDQRLLQGAEAKLLALGMIRGEIEGIRRSGQSSQTIKVVAPQDGILTQLAVREGMYVQPNTIIMTLADLSSVWLLADVFESQADWVATDQAAEARLDYLPGSVFSGEVDHVYPVLDPKTRTLRVRLKFDNPAERLKPNMYARVSIFGKLRPRALTIPREALIRGPERDRVVVAVGGGRFTSREVLTGMESGAWVEILAGIEEGEEVVTSAQFLLDSEASLAGSIERLEQAPGDTDDDAPVTAFGSGWVEAVDVAAHRIKIAHGPIDALGWPGMNMEFEADHGVDLSELRPGQDLRFQLRQADSGRFVIIAATPRDSGDEVTSPELIESLEAGEAGEKRAQPEHQHE